MPQGAGRRRLFLALGVACLLLVPAHVRAQADGANAAPPQIELALQVRLTHPRTIRLNELQGMPAVTVEVSHAGAKGVETSRFTGALLWTLLNGAGLVDENGPRTHLQHTLHARGRDGYGVALAIGELDPNFEGKQVLVAYEQDGRALAGLRLIVPADARAGRSVRDLVSIEVR